MQVFSSTGVESVVPGHLPASAMVDALTLPF